MPAHTKGDSTVTGKTEAERRAPITLAVVWKEKPAPKPKAKRTQTLSPEERERRRALVAAWNNDPAVKAKRLESIKASIKAKWADPEFREKRTAEIRRALLFRADESRERLKKLWADPEYRERMTKMAKDVLCSEENRELSRKRGSTPHRKWMLREASKRYRDRKRGFKIPPSKMADYKMLVNVKGYTAREAGVMLGLIKVAERKAA